MFEQLLQQVRGFFLHYKDYLPEVSDFGTKACDDLRASLTLANIQQLDAAARIMLYTVSSERYEDFKFLVGCTTNILLLSPVKNPSLQADGLDILIMCTRLNATMADILSGMGLTGQAWDYEMRALLPSRNPTETTIDYQKCFQYWLASLRKPVPEAREIIMHAVAQFFYLGRLLGHMYPMCHEMYTFVKKWLYRGERTTELDIGVQMFYAGILAATATVNHDSEEILAELKSQFQRQCNIDPMIAVQIAETLASTFGAMMGEDVTYWASNALQVPGIELHPHRKSSMELTVFLRDNSLDKDKVLKSIQNYLRYLQKEVPVRLINELQRQRLSELILRPIWRALQAGENDFAVQLSYLWRTSMFDSDDFSMEIEENELIILIVPNLFPDEIVYIVHSKQGTNSLRLPTGIDFNELLQIKNAFEGTWTVMLKQTENITPMPMHGHPNVHMSAEYLNKLIRFFSPNAVASELNSSYKIRVIESTWMNIPISALIGIEGDFDISRLVTSIRKPQGHISKVLIWCDPDGSLFRSHLEKQALEYILCKHQIEYEVYSENDCTAELFLEKYRSGDFDVLWLICHGAFNSDNPLQSELHVSSDKTVTLEMLHSLDMVRDTRRLLVLNACQSGTSSIRSDSMGFMGFGPALTNETQSVIGHLWSVDSFAAGVFGSLCLWHLLHSNTWGQAVNRARRDLALGNIHIIDVLSDVLSDEVQLLNSMNHVTDDLSQILHWGAPVLFE